MELINVSDDVRRVLVNSVQDAVENDILSDVRTNDLWTTNSVPSRIWDLINRNIRDNADPKLCTVVKATRNPWQMSVVFDKESQCVITLMREKRFSEICKKQRSRRKMHYLDMLTKHFNADLISQYEQLCIEPHRFLDEDYILEKIQIMLSDLQSETELIRHHVLVLFEAKDYELINIRAVMLSSSLDFVCEENWTQMIAAHQSVIVDTITEPNKVENEPSRGIKLKSKALERKKDRPNAKVKDTEIKKEG